MSEGWQAVVAVDFDGTIVEHAYPEIGKPVPGAVDAIKALIRDHNKVILLTMRSGRYLDAAVEYCREHGVEFWAVNSNPEQHEWTDSPKVYAQVYIDDAALGCPVIAPMNGRRPFVDWGMVRLDLEARGILERQPEAAQ